MKKKAAPIEDVARRYQYLFWVSQDGDFRLATNSGTFPVQNKSCNCLFLGRKRVLLIVLCQLPHARISTNINYTFLPPIPKKLARAKHVRRKIEREGKERQTLYSSYMSEENEERLQVDTVEVIGGTLKLLTIKFICA